MSHIMACLVQFSEFLLSYLGYNFNVSGLECMHNFFDFKRRIGSL